jgi:hypothetical protein
LTALSRRCAEGADTLHTRSRAVLLVASEYLRELESGSRVMLVFSDMQEDLAPGVQRRLSEQEFDGIYVAAMNVKRLGTDNANPAAFRGRLASWERRVLDAGGRGWRMLMDPSKLASYLREIRAS